jgi:predicted lipoprotein with Yx(FWY)xxD motif
MTLRPIPFLALGATAAIALAGCGSSGGGSTAAAASSSAATTAAASSGGAATIATRKTSLGTILVDGQGRTLYLWVPDKGGKSVCDGGCAQVWPPVLTKGAPKAGAGVKASLLGTTKRKDGTTEVTYKNHPLYTYVDDKAPGDTTGQGSGSFGAPWWVLSPAGNAITTK